MFSKIIFKNFDAVKLAAILVKSRLARVKFEEEGGNEMLRLERLFAVGKCCFIFIF